MVKVFLDAGHGGHDSGVASNGLREKDLVLKIALKTRDILLNEYSNIEVKLSRDTDKFVLLNDRARMARDWGADAFVSIHLNGFNGKANGIETFMHSNSTASSPLRQSLHSAIKSKLEKYRSITDRGVKSANFAVLRGTYQTMYSVLTESLFLDNKADAEILKKESGINDIARGHAEGIADFFDLKRKNTSQPQLNKERNKEEIYLKPTGDTLKNVVKDWLESAVRRGYINEKWLKQYQDGKLTLSDAFALKILIDERPPSQTVYNAHKEAWEKAEQKGLLNGERPNEPLTRSEFSTVIDRLGLFSDK